MKHAVCTLYMYINANTHISDAKSPIIIRETKKERIIIKIRYLANVRIHVPL